MRARTHGLFPNSKRALDADNLPGLRTTCEDAPVGWVGLLLATVNPLAVPVDGRRVSAHQWGAGKGAPLDGGALTFSLNGHRAVWTYHRDVRRATCVGSTCAAGRQASR